MTWGLWGIGVPVRLSAHFDTDSDRKFFPDWVYAHEDTDPDRINRTDPTHTDLQNSWFSYGLDQRQPHIERGVHQGPAHPDAPLTDTEKFLQNMGHEFATRIHQSVPTEDYIYRGMRVPTEWIDRARNTGSVRLPLSSFDTSDDTAAYYARPDKDDPPGLRSVVLQVAPGAKSYSLIGDGPMAEHVTHGDFAVDGVRLMEPQEVAGYGGHDEPPVMMHIRQRSVPAPAGTRHAHRTAMPWYHNTDAELNPGDMLLPAAEQGHKSRWAEDEYGPVPTYDPQSVYMYNEQGDPVSYAFHGKNRYEVEPVGEIKRDPEYYENLEYYAEELNRPEDHPEGKWAEWNVPAYNSYVAPRARVIRKLNHRTAMPYEDYRGSHRPGGPDHGAPFHDLNQMWGEDIYSHPEWYDSMDYGIKNIQRQLNQARGNPDHPVVIYRAVPHGVTDINTGDWVTTSLSYAQAHAEQSENPEENFPIVQSTVPAKHVWTNNDLHEWGYHGPNLRGEIVHPDQIKKARTMTAAVTVYTKPSCPQCDMTHKLLDRLGVEHDTVDVTTDPQAHAYITGLGYQQAPVVVVGDGEAHWSGFKPDHLKGLVSGE